MDVTNLKTITFDSAKYKLVPVDPSTQMLDGGFDGINLSWDAMLAEVPDQLPGVVVHSGEPYAKVDCNDDCCWADILPDNDVKVGTLLYTHPAPSQPSAEALVQAALEAAAKECETAEVPIDADVWLGTRKELSAATAIGLAAITR